MNTNSDTYLRDDPIKYDIFYKIVLTAVCQNGLALQFASERLRSDREIVLFAVCQNGLALQFASEILRSDP